MLSSSNNFYQVPMDLRKIVRKYVSFEDLDFNDTNLHNIVRLHEIFDFSLSCDSVRHIIESTCLYGDLKTLKWVLEKFDSMIEDYEFMSDLFEFVCTNGHLEIARFIHEVFRITRENIYYIDVFESVCNVGNLEMAKWIANIFSIRKQEFFEHTQVFVSVCINGKLDIAKWMSYHFGVEKKNFNFVSILDSTILRGYLGTVKWLTKNFEMSSGNYELASHTLVKICAKGYYRTAKWSIKEFKFKKAYVINEFFRTACIKGFLEILIFLVKTYHLTKDDINIREIIEEVSRLGKENIIDWLTSTF